MRVVVGSRGSKLALAQTNWVISKLKSKNPNVDFELKIIKTKGDKIQHISLDKIGGKGLFVKEIEQQLLDGDIDMAVHSMKDMPAQVPEGLKFSHIPKREEYRDVIVLKEGYTCLKDLPKGAKIGTGSKRRKYQILRYRPDLNVVSIRGNIDTRIKKIKEQDLDGVILAAAGINRLNIQETIKNKIYYLSTDIVLPAPAQGALAIEVRENNKEIEAMLKDIQHKETEIQIKAERAFLEAIDGSCHIPVGALCSVKDESIKLDALFGTEDGQALVRKSLSGKAKDARKIGFELAEIISKEL
ncbi:hydroxymethylbilane synthase [Haloimpatiens sp. FM7330]|uniref:hydroxymethylbilane synthase n=1 Tax=Haloimpatiens sp. FM7330 TaxID=3298610 RepID=UPI0036443956